MKPTLWKAEPEDVRNSHDDILCASGQQAIPEVWTLQAHEPKTFLFC